MGWITGRPYRWSVALAVVAVALLTLGASRGSTPITAGRLGHAVGPTAVNLYLLQQSLIGRPGLKASSFDPNATCTKGSPATPDRGPGDDWLCLVALPSAGGQPFVAYDVRVQPGGCYTAEGSVAAIGQQTLRDTRGQSVTNPLYQFDGCFDAG